MPGKPSLPLTALAHFSPHRPEKRKVYECVAVGSGPGACMAACMLSEAGREALILEEGLLWPREAVEPFSLQEMLDKYRNGGITRAFGKPPVQYVEGCCAGGGSEVNSGIYHRLPGAVQNMWEARWLVDGFAAGSLAEHASVVERDLSVSLLPGEAPRPSRLLEQGAAALGWDCPEAPRWQKYTEQNPVGERQTMSRTYLPRALKAGALMATDARVTHIARDKQNTWLLQVETGRLAGEPQRITVRAASLFLGAGAIQTPVILQRSRIGHRPGAMLHMHPSLKVTALFPDEVNSPDMGVPVHQVKEFSPEMSMGCSISSPHYLSANLVSMPRGLDVLRDKWRRMAVYYVMIVPEGRGSVHALPGFRAPVVRMGLTRQDMGALSLGLQRLCKLLFAAGAVRLFPGVAGLGPFNGMRDLARIPPLLPRKDSSLMTIHLTSTTAMSGDPQLGVTDSWGAVHGEKNLFVCDAGLLCSAPGVNPQGSLLALVRRNIQHWLQ